MSLQEDRDGLRKPWNHLLPLAVDCFYAAAFILALPYLVAIRKAGHSLSHIIRRRGNIRIPESGKPRLWIHGVSVGEVLSARSLVQQIRELHPSWELVFSATSRAGLEAVRRAYPDHPAFEYPFDFSLSVDRAFQSVRPDLILIVEHEFWPNFLHRARCEGIPVVVVNALVSDRSVRGYRFLWKIIRWPPQAIVHYCAQNQETLERLVALGVDPGKVTVTGNLKYDNLVQNARDLREELGIPEGAWVFAAASTHAGEEELILDVFGAVRSRAPQARLLLIPRRPERARAILDLARRNGFDACLGSAPASNAGVLVVDTMGDIPACCRTADAVFVGGSLVPFGGHNVIEPASFARPVVIGPYHHNFRSVVADFLARDAILVVQDGEELRKTVGHLHDDREWAKAMGLRARETVLDHGGASRCTIEVLAPLLEGIAGPKTDRAAVRLGGTGGAAGPVSPGPR